MPSELLFGRGDEKGSAPQFWFECQLCLGRKFTPRYDLPMVIGHAILHYRDNHMPRTWLHRPGLTYQFTVVQRATETYTAKFETTNLDVKRMEP